MYKILTGMFALLLMCQVHAQKQRRISTNIDFHINSTLYDRTLSNNGVGFGLALQTTINTNTKLKPIIEIASDAYGGTKQLFLTTDGKPILAKSSVTTVLAGAIFNTPKLYLAVIAGAGFFNSKTYLAVKPCAGYQLFNNRIIAKIAWANIFQRDDISDESFGYVSFGIGVKLF